MRMMLCRHPGDGVALSEVSEKAAAAESEQRRLFLTGARELARLHDEVSRRCLFQNNARAPLVASVASW